MLEHDLNDDGKEIQRRGAAEARALSPPMIN